MIERTEKLDKEYIDLIRKIAWGFARAYREDVDDLINVAFLMYTDALETHNPSKGALSTHLTHTITGKLRRYLNSDPMKGVESLSVNTPTPALQREFIHVKEVFSSLSEDAMVVVGIIQDASSYLFSVTPKKAKKAIYEKLQETEHWNRRRIKETVLEIKSCLSATSMLF